MPEEIQHSKEVSRHTIVLEVERAIADEEREGGHTARSLASLIVSRVLLNLLSQGAQIPAEFMRERPEFDELR